MAVTITPSLRSALERLKHGGCVNGLLLGWRRQLLINLLPFEEFRAERLLQAAHDAHAHFASGGDRDVKSFWFGYEGVFVLALLQGECMLIMLHTHASEVDFLRRAGLTFLDDTQLLVDQSLEPIDVLQETANACMDAIDHVGAVVGEQVDAVKLTLDDISLEAENTKSSLQELPQKF
jgi:hypothetical protein